MSEHHHLRFWTEALNLRDFHVVHQRRDTPADPLRLTVAPNLTVALCPHCGKPTDTIHRTHDSHPVKDLPLGPQPVDLIVRTHQYHCLFCDAYFTPHYPAVADGAHATERFLQQAAKLIRFSDVANAAAFFGVPEKTLEHWYYDYIQRQTQTPAPSLKPIESLGIDELSLKKSIVSS